MSTETRETVLYRKSQSLFGKQSGSEENSNGLSAYQFGNSENASIQPRNGSIQTTGKQINHSYSFGPSTSPLISFISN